MPMESQPYSELGFEEGIHFWVEADFMDHPRSCQLIGETQKYLMLGLLPRGRESEEILIKYPGNDALYFFKSFILVQSEASPGKFIWEISKPERVYRRQDRRFLRARLNFQVFILDQKGNEVEETVGMDISGGGMAIALPDDLDVQINDLFYFRLVFPTREVVSTAGRIVRRCEEQFHMLAGVEFVDMERTDQETLVRLAFQADWAQNVKTSQRF